MPRKDVSAYLKKNCYLGCEVPKPFFLRYQAMAEVRSVDRRTIQAMAMENEIERWERKLDQREGQAYDTLLEVKARQNGYSVNDLKAPLVLKPVKKGRKSKAANPDPHVKK